MASHDPPRGRVPWGMLAALMAPLAAGYTYHLRVLDLAGLRLAQPLALGLALLVVVVAGHRAFVRAARQRAALRHACASELARLPRGLVARLAPLPGVLRVVALLLCGLALARPQTSRVDDEIDLEGIDIVVTLDVSGSMEEVDLVPNRLEAAKAVIRDFVSRRRSDRLGLVVFGRQAYTYIPLTLDHATYLRMLSELRLGIVDGRGTAIGNGLGVALARLRKSDARSKVIILLTDGENNAGNISPREAAEMAQALGVKIYTILAGAGESAREEGEPGGDGAAGAQHPINPRLLEEIATLTGGNPYLATDTEALARRFEAILADLEKSRIRDRGLLYAELYPIFLWPALALFALEQLLSLTRFRRLP